MKLRFEGETSAILETDRKLKPGDKVRCGRDWRVCELMGFHLPFNTAYYKLEIHTGSGDHTVCEGS